MGQPKRLVIVSVILATALLSTGAASGLTAWQQFGSATGTGRGYAAGKGFFSTPYLEVQSTTTLNPVALQFVVTAPSSPVKTNVVWQVNCWSKDDEEITRVGGLFSATPPITKVITAVNVASFNYCELIVKATTDHKGGLRLSLQAQYP
jgi:hypothetical protein